MTLLPLSVPYAYPSDSQKSKRPRTLPVPTEQQEAEALAAYLRIKGYAFTHVANETGGDPSARRRAVRVKRAGVSKGFPDFLIFKDGERYAIELKRQKGSKTSPEQLKWLQILAAYGFKAAICHGRDEAVEFIEGTSDEAF